MDAWMDVCFAMLGSARLGQASRDPQLRVQCGTHVNEPEILTVDWAEERATASGEIDFSSALRDPTSLVPKPVATLWQYALEGRHFYVRATEGFWASPYARPFRAMRAECKPN